jgi:hypothetical protein
MPSDSLRVDLRGQRFGRLTVVAYTRIGRHSAWVCRCSCGRYTDVVTPSLRNGNTRSCGCLHRDEMSVRFHKHGERIQRTDEYEIWSGMIKRCENPNTAKYHLYGGRGVKVCARWRRSFANFLIDMGRRPSKRHSLDRFPANDGDYCPENCRWATPTEQARNTRRNRMLTYRGRRLCLAAWAERAGIAYSVLYDRVARGWTAAEAIEGKRCA